MKHLGHLLLLVSVLVCFSPALCGQQRRLSLFVAPPLTPVQSVGLPFLLDFEIRNESSEALDLASDEHTLGPVAFSIAYRPDDRTVEFCSSNDLPGLERSDRRLRQLLKARRPSVPIESESLRDLSPQEVSDFCFALVTSTPNYERVELVPQEHVRQPMVRELAPGGIRRARVVVDRDYYHRRPVFDLPGTYLVQALYQDPTVQVGARAVTVVRVVNDDTTQAEEYGGALRAAAGRGTSPDHAARLFRRVIDADPLSEYGKFARYYFGVFRLKDLEVSRTKRQDVELLRGTGAIEICSAPNDLFPTPELAMPCRLFAGMAGGRSGDLAGAAAIGRLLQAAQPQGYDFAPGLPLGERQRAILGALLDAVKRDR